MMIHSGILRTPHFRTIACLLILAALCGSVQAGSGIWTTNGPFATGLGNKVVYALAVSPDGSIIYCGTGSGNGRFRVHLHRDGTGQQQQPGHSIYR